MIASFGSTVIAKSSIGVFGALRVKILNNTNNAFMKSANHKRESLF